MIQSALFSVTDKTNLSSFAKGLLEIFPEIRFLASGNTAKELKEASLPVTPIEVATGFPECFGGRVKTLHPRIAGGILQRRGQDDREAKQLGIEPIDLVVCNLYAFEKAAANPSLSIDELFEQMDIGGSTLIRSACKNLPHTVVVTDPKDYSTLLEELRKTKEISLQTKKQLALKALRLSASYEEALLRVFSDRLLGEEIRTLPLTHGRKLRYGENPDQEGWVYSTGESSGVAGAEVLGGKELSYNNYEDASNAYLAAKGLLDLGAKEGAVVIKHGGICGYAMGPNAFRHAWNGDPKSAYGSVIALASAATDALIEELRGKFIEVLIAPDFSDSFVAWAKKAKPNLRLLKVSYVSQDRFRLRGIAGGLLIQSAKPRLLEKDRRVPTQKQVDAHQEPLLAFTWAAAAFSKSNAIAIAHEVEKGSYQLLGVGAGQPNRIDSMEKLAIPRALETLSRQGQNPSLSHSVLASDGFFPFADSIHIAGKAGIGTCIQPGGSIHDDEVIAAANEYGMCMIFTNERTFNH